MKIDLNENIVEATYQFSFLEGKRLLGGFTEDGFSNETHDLVSLEHQVIERGKKMSKASELRVAVTRDYRVPDHQFLYSFKNKVASVTWTFKDGKLPRGNIYLGVTGILNQTCFYSGFPLGREAMDEFKASEGNKSFSVCQVRKAMQLYSANPFLLPANYQ